MLTMLAVNAFWSSLVSCGFYYYSASDAALLGLLHGKVNSVIALAQNLWLEVEVDQFSLLCCPITVNVLIVDDSSHCQHVHNV